MGRGIEICVAVDAPTHVDIIHHLWDVESWENKTTRVSYGVACVCANNEYGRFNNMM